MALATAVVPAGHQGWINFLEYDVAVDDASSYVVATRHFVHDAEKNLFENCAKAAGSGVAQQCLMLLDQKNTHEQKNFRL